MKGNKGKLFRDKTYSADAASGSVRADGREEGAAMHRAAENGKFFAEKCNLFRAGALYKRKQGRRSGFRAA